MNTTTIILLMTTGAETLPCVVPYVQTATSRLLALGIEATVAPYRELTECRSGDELGPAALAELRLDTALSSDLRETLSKVEAGLKSLAKDVGHAIKFKLLVGDAPPEAMTIGADGRGRDGTHAMVGC